MQNKANVNKLYNNSLLRNSTGLGLIVPVICATSTRYFSTNTVKVNKPNPESLALDHIISGKPTTSSVINKILINQNISVTEDKLEELLKVKGIELDLPIYTLESKNKLAELTGKSKYKGFFGTYMFIHKKTGYKYVGSSNLLRRRMDYYFNIDKLPIIGKFLPLLKNEGLDAFKLIIFKLPSNKFSLTDAMLLEQYYLLNKEFNLNTLRVVNTGSSKGETIYIYDLNCKFLYYKSNSKIELKRVFNIHPETITKYMDSKIPYLNKFFLFSFPIDNANLSSLSISELLNIMQEERKKAYTLGTRRSIPVLLEVKKGNIYAPTAEDQTLTFESLTSCIEYLKSIGLNIKRDTLSRYIKIEKEFHKFLCKLDNSLPIDFEEIGFIINEYKDSINNNPNGALLCWDTQNKKNKSVIVKGEYDTLLKNEFNSVTDTIEYFYSVGIKLDRKMLYLRLKDNKPYKGYYFKFK